MRTLLLECLSKHQFHLKFSPKRKIFTFIVSFFLPAVVKIKPACKHQKGKKKKKDHLKQKSILNQTTLSVLRIALTCDNQQSNKQQCPVCAPHLNSIQKNPPFIVGSLSVGFMKVSAIVLSNLPLVSIIFSNLATMVNRKLLYFFFHLCVILIP